MRLGKLLQVGRPVDLYRSPVQREAADFFGHVNWLPATVVDDGIVDTPVGRLGAKQTEKFPPGANVLVGFRPESVSLGLDAVDWVGSFTASLMSSMFLGDAYLHKLKSHDLPILAKSAQAVETADGQVVLSISSDQVMVFPAEDEAWQRGSLDVDPTAGPRQAESSTV
jgi:ABC-type Fe3+/spermidine/putrescine transport system ATPase subunit